jgi:hypothetical protein
MADQKRNKTPMYAALHAARYHRQELIRHIQDITGNSLIAYVCGPEALISRADTAFFNDLLYSVKPDSNVDLVLHTPGGDIDAAEKLMAILRARIGIGRLRVIVPDFAKSAGTLMALGADEIVMSDTSELGPIDPQVTVTDGDGNRSTQSVQAYLDAYEQLSERLSANADDLPARLLLSKLEPDRIVYFTAVKARARSFAEAQLRRGMCRESGNVTRIVEHLLNTKKWPSHGQMINAEVALREEIPVTRVAATDRVWDAIWRLYCLQRLAVKENEKLFESDSASLITVSPL